MAKIEETGTLEIKFRGQNIFHVCSNLYLLLALLYFSLFYIIFF